jgi:hypothetical protein
MRGGGFSSGFETIRIAFGAGSREGHVEPVAIVDELVLGHGDVGVGHPIESLFGNILNWIKRLWFKGNGLSRGEVADVDDREPCAVRPQQTAVSERFDG